MDNHKKIKYIIDNAINAVLPDNAVESCLNNTSLDGDIHVISIGKAAWKMCSSAVCHLQKLDNINYCGGICITKYDHSEGPINKVKIFEAGHPTLDQNSIIATEKAIEYAKDLSEKDTVLFLVSGGGSALFESPTISFKEYKKINDDLLSDGSSIETINCIRKKYSKVKGGKFADVIYPAKIINLILSDVLGDKLDTIASGPTIKPGVKSVICGNVNGLCEAAKCACEELGYDTKILKQNMCGQAKDEALWFADQALKFTNTNKKIALIAGGETVVEIKGSGKGGRNQEFALSVVNKIADTNITIFSIGSDGTDGPTDAAGGFADGNSYKKYKEASIDINEYLDNNDSYNALNCIGQLIKTGPTGTNVNDVAVALIN